MPAGVPEMRAVPPGPPGPAWRPTRVSSGQGADPASLASVFLFFLSILLLTCSGHIGGDGMFVYYTAESLVLDVDFDLSNVKPEFPGKENA